MDNAVSKSKVKVMSFSAINQVVETNIVSAKEKSVSGRDYLQWGTRNRYPQYIAELRDVVPTLSSVISGLADYICGDDVILNVNIVEGHPTWADPDGTTINDLVRGIAEDLATFNGFVPEIILSKDRSRVAAIKQLPIDRVRVDKDVQSAYYSESWGATTSNDKILVLPIFSREFKNEDSVLFVKADRYSVYPHPTCAPAVIGCELERSIDKYHLNNINNSFMGTFLVNFNNGVPSEEEMSEIESTFNAKYCGSDNAGRCLFSWNENMQSRTTLEQLKTDDFGEKYQSLADRAQQQIFTAFRANPNLFGLPTASGFNSEEFESAFKLFNRTMVRPMQRLICDTFDRILGVEGSITIKPFTLEGTVDNNIE